LEKMPYAIEWMGVSGAWMDIGADFFVRDWVAPRLT